MDAARALPRGLADSCSYAGLGLLALALLWVPGPYAMERLVLVAVMGAIVYAAFFVAVLAMPLYGGGAYDDNGYQPFAAPLPIVAKRWDVNITAFCIQVALLAAGSLAILGAALRATRIRGIYASVA